MCFPIYLNCFSNFGIAEKWEKWFGIYLIDLRLTELDMK